MNGWSKKRGKVGMRKIVDGRGKQVDCSGGFKKVNGSFLRPPRIAEVVAAFFE